MSYLTLKSTVSEVYDYKKVEIGQFIPEFTPDPARLQKDMDRILASHGKRVNADVIESGDMVILSCLSDNKRFNKERISVIIGRGLFCRELEAKLIGMASGECREFSVGDDKTEVTVHEISRNLLPPLTDETVSAWGMDGITTVDALRKHCIDRQIESFLDEDEDADMASAYIGQFVAENSVFALDALEEAYVDDTAKKKLNSLPQGEADIGDDFKQTIQKICINNLKIAVIGCRMAAENCALLTDEDYEAVIQKQIEFSEMSLTHEQAMLEYPVMEFLINRYADIYNKKIDAYVADYFKKAMNP